VSASSSIRTEALAASAGTGKTFALSSRYIALLATGADPASIVALTFTRKAAGEILARILSRLAAGALDDTGHQTLTEELNGGGYTGFPDAAATRTALRAMVQALPILRIGTLDSFFIQILQQFRLEIGLSTDPVITEADADAQEDRILQRLLEQADMTDEQQRELMEAFKLATFGEEKKSVYSSIQTLIEDQFELFQRTPNPEVWGHPDGIWGTPNSWNPPAAKPDWTAGIDRLRESVHPESKSEKAWKAFLDLLTVASTSDDAELKNKLPNEIYRAFSLPGGGVDSITYNRAEIAFPPEAQEALRQLMSDLRTRIIGRQIVRTAGLFRLLALYGPARKDHILRTGQIAFSDIAHLLAPAEASPLDAMRLQIDCRLDARFRHWLLDEFQDTSLIQWQVLENLLDEVIQNPDGERTLFYVGDTKQAIYEWRSGDPRLFRRILRKYNRPGQPKAIEEARPLIRSWRSSPIVLNAVNTVFGHLPDLSIPDALAEDWPVISSQWDEEWNDHEAADKNKNLSGTMSLHVLPKIKRGEEGPGPMEAVVQWVRHLQEEIPTFNSYTVGILTRTNKEALSLHLALEAEGIRSDLAGDESLTDNVLVPVIVSLARLIEHPGDTLARQHIAMSPLKAQLELTPGDLARHGRRIQEQGYTGWLTDLTATLQLPEKAALERVRLRQLIPLTAEFDRQPNGTALRFASYVNSLRLPASRTGSHIEVLTMHKAKGLEYDIVLLPTLKGHNGITSRGGGAPDLMVHEGPGDDPVPPVDWILSPPRKFVKEADPILSEQIARDRRSGAWESLRLLYVAMTRAKRALHIFTSEPAPKSNTLYLENIVQNALAPDTGTDLEDPVLTLGEERWWESEPADKPNLDTCGPPIPLTLSDLPTAAAEPQLVSKTASESHIGGPLPAGRFFRPEGAAARELGTRVHELFEQIEWLTLGEIPDFAEADPAAKELVCAFLAIPANHTFFEKAAEESPELLREQAFEAVLDGKWLSGMIDRLHLVREANGTPVRAHVIDYKTDHTPDPERHRPQMEDYRQAVSLLFGLPPQAVTCTLLFVRTGTAIDI
jgi:ATP-dependent helicase/nuclease subunit A